jgi:hypothetical protein
MIYLIGVRHDLQFEPAPTDVYKIVRDKRALFKAHVLEVIEKLGITVLAEEFGDEAKTTWRVSESILEQFAKAKGIQHRFCDPDSVEKRALGIKSIRRRRRIQIGISEKESGSVESGTAKTRTCCSFVAIGTSSLSLIS